MLRLRRASLFLQLLLVMLRALLMSMPPHLPMAIVVARRLVLERQMPPLLLWPAVRLTALLCELLLLVALL